MLELLLTFLSFCLLLVSFKKAGALPFPTGFIFILFISQIVFALVHENILVFNMEAVMDYGGLKENYTFIQTLYTAIAAFSLLVLIGKFETIKSVKVDIPAIRTLSQRKGMKIGIIISLLFIFIHFILFLIVADWETLWSYKVYLSSIVDQRMFQFFGSTLSETIIRSALAVAILSSVCFCLSSNMGSPILKVVSAFYSLFYYLFFFSEHSRAAVLVPAFIGMNYFVMRPNVRKYLVPVFTIIFFFTLASAGEGRGHSEHGFASIPSNFSRYFSENIGDESLSVVVNLCEGIFSTAESLQIKAPFNSQYKILTFSPLPSFIDGFSDIRKSSEHRLHAYVPMSGIGEAINFGWPAFVLLILIYFLLIRSHSAIAKTYPTLFLLCNFLILFSLYHLLAYPLRNGLRFAWIAWFIILIGRLRGRRILIPKSNSPLIQPIDSPQNGNKLNA